MPYASIPLEAIPGWPEAQINKLKKRWITTAEQVVAIGATPDGLHSLARQLSVTEDEINQLVSLARTRLSDAERARLDTPVDTSQFGTGVRSTRRS